MTTSVLIRRGIKSKITPDPFKSDMQYSQFYHLDLPDLDDTELMDELNYRRGHLWGLMPDDWQRQRVKALETELRKRQGKTWRK
jgi:hypothetical protein